MNAYLIEDQPLTLVDTGPRSPSALAALRDGLRALGYALEDLERVVVTHQHPDHWGLARAVVDRSRADLYALAGLADWLAEYPASIAAEDRLALRVLQRHGASAQWLSTVDEHNRQARSFGTSVHVTHPLRDGDLLEFEHRTLRVLHLPGHSPSDTVFHDEKRGLLLGGDVLLPHQRSSALIAPPLDGAEVHVRPRAFAQYIESLRAVSMLELEVVLPGHGEAVHDHRPLIAERLRGYDRATNRVRDLLSTEPQTATEIAVRLKGRVVDAASFFALCEVLGYLDRLVDEDAAIETEEEGIKRFARPSPRGQSRRRSATPTTPAQSA